MFIHVFHLITNERFWTFEVLSKYYRKTVLKGQQLCEINFAPIAKNAFMQQKINEYGVKANSKHKLPQKFQFFETMVRSIRILNVDRKQNFNVLE